MQIVSVKEAAKVAGVSENSVRGWIEKKGLPTVDHEGLTGIPLKDLTAFLEQRVPPKFSSPPGPKPGAKKAAKAASKANGAAPAAAPKAAAKGKPGPKAATITIAEAAAMAGVSAPNVSLWIKQGKFPAERLPNRSVLIPRKGLEKFLSTYKGNPRKATTAPGVSASAAASGVLIPAEDAARMARVKKSTFYRWVKEGKFISEKQGGSRLVDRGSLEAFLATYRNPRAPRIEQPDPRQVQLPFAAVRALARGEERDAEFGGKAPRADALASLDMAQAIGSELGMALANYRKHVLREFFKEQLAKLDAEK